METTLEYLNPTARNNGLILGIITFIINILVYYVSPSLMASTAFGMGVIVVSIILYIVFILDMRRKIGGYWSFRDALRGIFLMALVAGITDALLKFIFYKYIEPGAYDKVIGFVVDNLTRTYERIGMDQDKIDEVLEKVKEGMKAQFNPSIGDFLKSLGMMIIVEFVMSLIFAAIFKKDKPMFMRVDEISEQDAEGL